MAGRCNFLSYLRWANISASLRMTEVEKMTDEARAITLESIYKEVRGYARIEFAALTRKVFHRMQRVEASGIFGDDQEGRDRVFIRRAWCIYRRTRARRTAQRPFSRWQNRSAVTLD
jgi:hypothetical protein